MNESQKKLIKVILLVVVGMTAIFLVTIPWRRYVFNRNIVQGDELLITQNYTGAYVKYQKAALLQIDTRKAEKRQVLAKDSARSVLDLRQFLAENRHDELKKLIDDADSKVCRLDSDRLLIENNLPEIAKVNLEFCANSGPKDYQSWIILGLANIKLSESNTMFSELKPEFRKQAAEAFSKAYEVDPVNIMAINYAIEVNKLLGNQSEVDRWQKLLDNLNRIEK